MHAVGARRRPAPHLPESLLHLLERHLGGRRRWRAVQVLRDLPVALRPPGLRRRAHLPLLSGHGHEGVVQDVAHEVDDPGNLVGDNGEEFVALMPVEGSTTVWSTPRYNAMAKAVGNLPLVEVPMTLGDPSSYATTPSLPDGSPIPAADMVFPDPPEFLVSDVGTLGWWLAAEEQETNSVAMESQLDINASVTVSGFTFGSEVGAGWGEGYSVSVGSEFFFGGGVPPIPDDPSTPEDEYAQYRFGFSPVVYRHHYTDPGGSDAAMYVLDYTVGF